MAFLVRVASQVSGAPTSALGEARLYVRGNLHSLEERLTQDANEFLMGGGVKSAKFEAVGTVVKGTIVAKPELQQQRDIKDGKPLTWDNGDPKMQVKIVLQTEQRDDADDDGRRSLYVKANMLKAVQDAVKKAGAKGLEVGGVLGVKYVKDGEKKNKGFNAPKLYAAKYEAPDPMAAAAEPEAAAESESLDDF